MLVRIFSPLGWSSMKWRPACPPFRGDNSAEIFDSILNHAPAAPVRLNPDLPVALEYIINKALEKDRGLRYQQASEMQADLQRLKRDTDSGRSSLTSVVAAQRAEPAKSFWQRRRLIVATGFLFIIGAAVAGYVMSRPMPKPRVLRYTQLSYDGVGKIGSLAGVGSLAGLFPSPMVTDGSRIFLQEGPQPTGGSPLVQISTGGGETSSIPIPFGFQIADISPTGSELLIVPTKAMTVETPLTVLPLPTGSPRRIGDVIAHDASWSPDGERIIYANRYDLYVVGKDGSDPKKLITTQGVAWWPRWSPDGRTIRFTQIDAKTNSVSLWEILADGSRLKPLLAGWNNVPAECCGSWTPDGKYFVFQSTHDSKTDIWLLRERIGVFQKDDPEPVQLTSGQMSMFAPVVCRDGKRLFAVGVLQRGELTQYDPKSKQFASFLSGISADGLDFSRDRQWAAYSKYPENTLWRSKIDGSERLQLTFPPLVARLPRWSPDGQRITFFGKSAGKPWKIYLMSADGGRFQQVTEMDQNEADPGWSSDGSAIIFGGAPWAEAWSSRNTAIHVFDLKAHRLSTLRDSAGLFSPHRSPDGQFIAALPANQQGIMLFDMRTQTWKELIHFTAGLGYPNWSHDGRYIYFIGFSAPGSDVFRVRVADGAIERVVHLVGFRVANTFGPWLGLTPDDSPLLVRDTGSQEIYDIEWKTQ